MRLIPERFQNRFKEQKKNWKIWRDKEVFKEEREIKSGCKKCNGTGYVFYTKEINNKKYKYSAVCDCGRCERYDGTKCADPKNKSKYYIPTIAETGLNIQENKPTNNEIVKSMKVLVNSSIISENIKNLIRENFRRRVNKWEEM